MCQNEACVCVCIDMFITYQHRTVEKREEEKKTTAKSYHIESIFCSVVGVVVIIVRFQLNLRTLRSMCTYIKSLHTHTHSYRGSIIDRSQCYPIHRHIKTHMKLNKHTFSSPSDGTRRTNIIIITVVHTAVDLSILISDFLTSVQ